jgi:putative aldouronate transport system substrate-binding protein
MNKRFLRLGSLIISTALAASALAGCGKSTTTPSSSVSPSASAQTDSKTTYPLKTDVKLTYWSPINPNVSANYKNMGDTPYAKELEKKTGVKVEYLHPAVGQEGNQFNVLAASGDLPDVIEVANYWFTGGPELAIQNKIVLKANDYINQYAPNLKKYLKDHPDIDKSVKTDSGSYYCFPFIRGADENMTYNGLAIRNDWLKDLNLQTPTTIDEWYTVLKAFKEQKNATAPLSWAGATNPGDPFAGLIFGGAFVGAYGILNTFYMQDGKVKYGPFEPGYKDFLTTMAKWYKEGLIDKNFASTDLKAFDANFLSGKTGASAMNVGGGIGKYVPAFKDKDPKADLQPAPYPTLKKGETPEFGQRDNPFAAGNNGLDCITPNSKNVEIAAKWLDYGYSEEGNLLNNFGIEGVSYKMENGSPVMTDEVIKNPKGLSIGQAWAQYARATGNGPFVQRKEYSEQYNPLPAQKAAMKVWTQTNAAKHKLPSITPTPEESSQYSKIISDVNTAMTEFSLKVVMGTESINNYDKFIDQLKKIGIEKAISIQQAALDRYYKR